MYYDAHVQLIPSNENPLFVKHIDLLNFRNFSDLHLDFHEGVQNNFIIAPNGMGKSNLLEGLYYLSHVRPFRQTLDRDLIRKGEKFFFLCSDFDINGIAENIKFKYSAIKEIILNNKKVKKHSELLGKLVTVLFSTTDIFIINGTPAVRRKFFDTFLSVMDNHYLETLRHYMIILKHKNAVLKEKRQDLLDVYNIQMVKLIVNLSIRRAEIINQLGTYFQEFYSTIGMFQDKVKIVYSPSIKSTDPEEVLRELSSYKTQELERGYSIVGSHKDNYLFLLKGIHFVKYASLGQTRLAALVLKLCQAIFYEKTFQTKPVLLLDDVILELDPEKKRRFIQHLPQGAQMFITLTDSKYIDWLKNKEYTIIEIENGQIKQNSRYS